jgi:excinuclease ABC subunit C
MVTKKLEQNQIDLLPHCPGVYIFLNQTAQPIYIGKATSLKNRVASYFKTTRASWKTRMIRETISAIEYVVTESVSSALLLEAALIKKYQPKFNILLKDGQPFVYILISKEPLPKLLFVRNKNKSGRYFGPFLHKGSARSVYTFLNEHLQLHLCGKTCEHGCLQYHLGHCAGSCRKNFDKDAYLFRLHIAQKILSGHTKTLKHVITTQIATCNTQCAFEQSKKLTKLKQEIESIITIIKLKFDPQKHIDITRPQKQYSIELSINLGSFLRLDHTPTTIDCFDISHFQSHAIVGSCVRFVHGVPDKHMCRHFNIKTLTTQHDCAALAEIVSRRYKNIAPTELPDLILIDGGKGQRNSIIPIMPHVPIISLAKKEETIFCSAYKNGIRLDLHSDVGKMLVALRDYAHHFAITHHRKKRTIDGTRK